MTKEQEPEPPHSDHAAHTAPAEHHPIKKNLWQRWVAWSGSFLVISILAHVVLLGGATVLVVQVVQSRKEKMKFTAPPPSAAGMVEHKVKPSKKAASAPAISKRITSTAASASIALPAMEMNSTGPDVMASVMSGLGSAGLGSGGAGGMASMPLAGLTAFGFKGATTKAGLVGYIYDLKQTADGKPTDIKDDGFLKDPHILDNIPEYDKGGQVYKIFQDKSTLGKRADLLNQSTLSHAAVLNELLSKNWDESVLKRYYRSKDPMTAYQIFIPVTSSGVALKAFGVEKEIKPTHYLVHYKGRVMSPKDGEFRFRVETKGRMDLIRFNNDNVYGTSGNPLLDMSSFKFKNTDPPSATKLTTKGYSAGKWFRVEAGKSYPMEILLESDSGGFCACVMIEERTPEKPYPERYWTQLFPQDGPIYCYPVFALMKGLPIPTYDKSLLTSQSPPPDLPKERVPFWRPSERVPETAPEPLVFPGTK
jgi:hypothetical protein